MNRICVMALAALVGLSVMGEAQAKSPLKLAGISRWNPNPTWAPTDTTIKKLVAAAANKYVGRTVTVDWGNYPPDATPIQLLQMREAAGTLPDILLQDNLMQISDAYEYAIKKGLIKEVTRNDLTRYMPGYVGRFKQYGSDVQFAIDENTKRIGDNGLGKLWYIPFQFQPTAFPAARIPNGFAKPWPNAGFTGGHFRDDILKMIFPAARTEAELRQLLLDKGGKLTVKDMTDIPITSWSDLYVYLKKVKALNLKVGEKPVIPGALVGSSENAASAYWSLTSAVGWLYKGNMVWRDPLENTTAVYFTPEFRDQMRWLNRIYDEGLMDPEIFVMKNDQYFAKVGNGEYAVVNWPFISMSNASKVGKERGYGWRTVPYFYPFDMSKISSKYTRVSFNTIGIFLTSRIKAADWGDVLKYVDYFMTEPSDDLVYWGAPAWSTGTGVNRRFTPEYKDLENWALYGKEGGKDGTYYGLASAPNINMAEGAHYQLDTKPFAFWQESGFTYPWAPYFSYRASPTWDPRVDLQNVDLISWTDTWWKLNYIGPNSIYYRISKGWDWWSYWNSTPEYNAYAKAVDQTTLRGLIAKAITGTQPDFEDNFDRFVKYNADAGLTAAAAAAAAGLKANWDSNIQQSILK